MCFCRRRFNLRIKKEDFHIEHLAGQFPLEDGEPDQSGEII